MGGLFSNLIVFLKQGGWMMGPLVLAILFAFYLVIERFFVLRILSREGKLIRVFREKVAAGREDELRHLLTPYTGIIAEVLKSGLYHLRSTPEQLDLSLKQSFYSNAKSLQKNLGTIQVMAALMPMMGLLGTVSGMIHIFGAVSMVGLGDPTVMASGISEALVATETGLAGAILVSFLHNFLANMAENIVSDVKEAGSVVHQCAASINNREPK